MTSTSIRGRLGFALSGLVGLLIAGCDNGSATNATRIAVLSGSCTDPASLVLLDATFVRSASAPQAESQTFASAENTVAPTLCIETTHVSSAVVSMNGVPILGPSSFHNADETFTVPFELLAENTVTVELRGKPCASGNPAACSTIRVRAVATSSGPPPPPLVVKQLKPLDACCSDPTCDKAAFASIGGVCPGDPRIRGPLAADANFSASP